MAQKSGTREEKHEITVWNAFGIHDHHVMHIPSGITVTLILGLFSIFAFRALKKKGDEIRAEKKFGIFSIADVCVDFLRNIVMSTMGKQGEKFIPLIGSIFVFILLSNLMGLIPGFPPPTENINTTLALGLFIFLFYNIMGFKEHGIGYLKQFVGPVWWLFFIMIPIELVSHIFRPLSLALRLKGNISGDHLLVSVFHDIIPFPIAIPVIFMLLGVMVAFIQSLVFSLLSMVYISLAISHDH